jgi:hypothetical protein
MKTHEGTGEKEQKLILGNTIDGGNSKLSLAFKAKIKLHGQFSQKRFECKYE